MKHPLPLIVLALALVSAVSLTAAEPGESTIRAAAGNSEIVITTTSRVAGAIHSLTWNDQEFIDSFDHGRQLQSAANFDLGREFFPEVFNPTEAGSAADGIGQRSTSRLLKLEAQGNTLSTTCQMAFWLGPGEKSAGQTAYNHQRLSEHLLTKRVTIGLPGLPHAIAYDVTFTIPAGEKHTYAQFEAVTGYMPPTFSQFWTVDLATGKLAPLDDGPGEQSRPVVFSTEKGSHAMGVYSPDQPSQGFEQAGYGRFRFGVEKVNKWNCVFRTRKAEGVPTGEHRFRSFVVAGSLEDVRSTIQMLARKFRAPGK